MFGGNSLFGCFINPNFSFVEGDIRDTEKLKKSMDGVDVIIHLAAIVGYPACQKNPELTKEINLEATKRLVDSVKPNQYVLFGSTGSNYGAVKDGFCTEETPLNPLSLYGETKTEAEKYLIQNCNSTAYRFATAFGLSPRLRLDLLVNDFVNKAVNQKYIVVYESHFMRTFIHVNDIARSFIFAIENEEKMRGQVYNVGGKEEITIENLALKVISQCQSNSKLNYISYENAYSSGFEETFRRVPDIQKINSELGWFPKKNLEEIIIDAINWSKLNKL